MIIIKQKSSKINTYEIDKNPSICEDCGVCDDMLLLHDGLYLCEKCLWIAREKKFNKIHYECESCGALVDEEELALAHFENDEKEETRECDIWICKKCCFLK